MPDFNSFSMLCIFIETYGYIIYLN